MALSISRFMALCFFFFFFLHLKSIHSLSSSQPLCHDDERTYLVQFMKSFNSSWKPVGDNADCCLWNGVECDEGNGHVISLLPDVLLGGVLNGPLDSNSSLFRLVHLQQLHIYECNFGYSKIPDSIENLRSLEVLEIRNCKLSGSIPSFLGNLTKLSCLSLPFNAFTPHDFSSLSWISHMTKVTCLDLQGSNLAGGVPSFLMNMTQLDYLSIGYNNLHGVVDMGAFNHLKNLWYLDLSFNNLSLLPESSVIVDLPVLNSLYLASCNLSSFPSFLRNFENLSQLDLSSNKLSGHVPEWFMNKSTDHVSYLNLSYNSLIGFKEKPQLLLHSTPSSMLDLSNNKLQGSIPVPSHSFAFYSVSRNNLSELIWPLFCNMDFFEAPYIDLSFNNFHGKIPLCMKNLMNQAFAVKLNNNGFTGEIPELWEKNCNLGGVNFNYNQLRGELPRSLANCQYIQFLSLRNNHMTGHLPSWLGYLVSVEVLDISQNQLEGQIPKSLVNCTRLEYLGLGNNQFNDSFPSWLGHLSKLKALSLKSNRLHGTIKIDKGKFQFRSLQILDISSNYFRGDLPFELFKHLKAMEIAEKGGEAYMDGEFYSLTGGEDLVQISLRINNKGNSLEYYKTPNALVVLDLSSNNFSGQIPKSLGDLRGLVVLNFSDNVLTGSVPSSLGNLAVIESLDLSRNMLSGEIPQELAKLDKLGFLDLSRNHLTGPVPRGRHLDTFGNSSYFGNGGLCGEPLSKKCATPDAPPPVADQDLVSTTEIDWKIVMIGYGAGIVIGVSIGYMFTTWKHEWFIKFVQKKLKSQTKRRMRRSTG